MNKDYFDVIIIGAGAAGLMCGIEAGKRGRKVLILDHANKMGKKILMSGGGKCNFTNLNVELNHYQCSTPKFIKSALSRYLPTDFLKLVEKHQVNYQEKKHRQLFCCESSKEIVKILQAECDAAQVSIQLKTKVDKIQVNPQCSLVDRPQKDSSAKYFIQCKEKSKLYETNALVIATGGLSIPTMGASPFGYHVAEQFGLKVNSTRAGLVPVTLHTEDKEKYAELSGVSLPCVVSCGKVSFSEDLLFTHRGLSGPAILQISSYWQPGQTLTIKLLADKDVFELLKSSQTTQPQITIKNFLGQYLPKRFVQVAIPSSLLNTKLANASYQQFRSVAEAIQAWQIKPNGTEGYRTAEVTLGGVDCHALSSKTFEVRNIPGLYFIGEVLDVTGWLGGYNFQWAWASGWAAGQVC